MLAIRLLGGSDFHLDEAPVGRFISTKAPALLAYLVVTSRPHQREHLAGLLWSEMADADARNNLRQTLSNLRKLLNPYLLIEGNTVRFDASRPHTLDTSEFERLLRAGRDVSALDRAAAFEQAATLYRGDFLAGLHVREAPDFEEWLLTRRVHYRELALHALHTLTEHHLAQAQYGRAIAGATNLLALDAWREEAHRQLMLALARSGRLSAALEQYEVCRRLLEEELGVVPSAATAALFERIRAAQAAGGNLPARPNPFIGRQTELAQVRDLLSHPSCRLITLTGPGGIGKTRLALESADEARQRGLFLNGVYFLSLEGVRTNVGLANAVAAACGFTLAGTRDPAEQLLTLLHNRETLLILDNFEGLVSVSAVWLSRLLQHAPNVRLLVTSRERLNVQWEHTLALGGLPAPAVPARREQLLETDAVQLFLTRAAGLGFTPSTQDLPHIAHICRLLLGIPLAVELAAANVGSYACADMATALHHNLDALTTTFHDLPERQRSLRAVFDYSWALLTPAEQGLFAALSVFQGDFTQDAAAQVADAQIADAANTVPAVRPLLAALVDKSLAWRRGDLFRLHDLSRQFGRDKLQAAGNLQQTAARHAHYYARLLGSEAHALQGANQPAALAHIEQQLDNVRAAWQWLFEQLSPAAYLAELSAAIDGYYHFLAIRSSFLEGLDAFRTARRALEPFADGDQAVRLLYIRVLAREGRFLSFLSRYEQAEERLQAALQLLREMGEPDETAFVLGHLGGNARIRGDLATAESRLQECLVLRRETGNLSGQAVALLELAGVAFQSADYERCRALCREGLTVAHEAGDRQTTAHLLTGLSLCSRELGRYDEALEQGRRAQRIYENLGDRYGVVQAALTLGELSRQLGRHEEARQLCVQAVQVSYSIGFTSGEADGHYRLGQIAADQEQPAEALRHFRTALALALATHEQPTMRDILLEICCLPAPGDPATTRAILTHLLNHQQLTEKQRRRATSALALLPEEATSPGPVADLGDAAGRLLSAPIRPLL